MKTINAGAINRFLAAYLSAFLTTSFYLIMLVYGYLTVLPAIVKFFLYVGDDDDDTLERPLTRLSAIVYAAIYYLIILTYFCFWIM